MISRIRLLVLAALVVSAVAAPGVASAATVSVSQAGVNYTAGAGENNNLTLSQIQYDYRTYLKFTDTGVSSVQAGQGCYQFGATTVYCPVYWFTHVSVDLGDGNDTFNGQLHSLGVTVRAGSGDAVIHGGGGNDTLIGGSGHDTLIAGTGNTKIIAGTGGDKIIGGPGNDTITARNGVADNIACGGGIDTVTADYLDTVASDCENVDATTPPPTQPAGGGGGGTPPATQSPPIAKIATAPAQVTNSGVVSVKLSCPAAASGGCDGTVTVELLTGGAGKAQNLIVRESRRRYRKRSSRHFKLAAGKSSFVPIHLDRRTWKALRHKKNLRARVTVTMKTASGTVRSVRTIKLHAARRFDRRRRRHR